jgi:hypothetical protein
VNTTSLVTFFYPYNTFENLAIFGPDPLLQGKRTDAVSSPGHGLVRLYMWWNRKVFVC